MLASYLAETFKTSVITVKYCLICIYSQREFSIEHIVLQILQHAGKVAPFTLLQMLHNVCELSSLLITVFM